MEVTTMSFSIDVTMGMKSFSIPGPNRGESNESRSGGTSSRRALTSASLEGNREDDPLRSAISLIPRYFAFRRRFEEESLTRQDADCRYRRIDRQQPRHRRPVFHFDTD